jgi:hypothetical protein
MLGGYIAAELHPANERHRIHEYPWGVLASDGGGELYGGHTQIID